MAPSIKDYLEDQDGLENKTKSGLVLDLPRLQRIIRHSLVLSTCWKMPKTALNYEEQFWLSETGQILTYCLGLYIAHFLRNQVFQILPHSMYLYRPRAPGKSTLNGKYSCVFLAEAKLLVGNGFWGRSSRTDHRSEDLGASSVQLHCPFHLQWENAEILMLQMLLHMQNVESHDSGNILPRNVVIMQALAKHWSPGVVVLIGEFTRLSWLCSESVLSQRKLDT